MTNKEITTNELTKQFTTYLLALKLHLVDFDEPCFGYYHNSKMGETNQELIMKQTSPGFYDRIKIPEHINVLAPTYSQAFNWFRKKGYFISLSTHDHNLHDFFIKWSPEKSFLSDIYDTYEEAEIACLEKLIEIVESK